MTDPCELCGVRHRKVSTGHTGCLGVDKIKILSSAPLRSSTDWAAIRNNLGRRLKAIVPPTGIQMTVLYRLLRWDIAKEEGRLPTWLKLNDLFGGALPSLCYVAELEGVERPYRLTSSEMLQVADRIIIKPPLSEPKT